MLELRPGCENCDCDLPPESVDAMICSFECTFCADCVDNLLENICPNCGGGFEKRPVRPHINHLGPHTGNRPPSTKRIHKPVDSDKQRELAAKLKSLAPHLR